jgi:ribonuclease P protein component
LASIPSSHEYRHLRLGQDREVHAVLSRGSRRVEKGMVVYVLPTGRPTRVAFVSGRRVGGAVERNRARRVLREAWRALRTRVRSGYDVVFVARPEIVGAKAEEMAGQMARALDAHGVVDR